VALGLILTVEDSSKLTCKTPVHGGRGNFLASLSAVSLLSVTSHHHLHHSHNTLTMHKSTILSRQTPSPSQLQLISFSHGTRVTVRDLFGNMPVRVKQRPMSAEKPRANSKEWEELRRDLVLLLLSWPRSVAVTVRDLTTNEKLLIRGYTGGPTSRSADQVDVSAVCSVLSQASLISIEDKPFWVSARASTPKIAISAAISLLPSAAKHTQFISFGIQPLVCHDARSILHDEVNRMFLNSAFGNDGEAVGLDASKVDRRAKDKRYKGDGFTNKELRGGRKGIDRWPMFYINIQQNAHSMNARTLDIDDILDDKGSSLGVIVELLQAMVWEFLAKHHFRPKPGRGRRTRQTGNVGYSDAQDLEASEFIPELTTNIHSETESSDSKRKSPVSRPQDSPAKVKALSSQQPPSRSDAPFDVWTRVKSGSRPTKVALHEKLHQASDASHIPRPFSAPPSSTSRKSTPIPTHSSRAVAPLLSNKGKIIRRPFEEEATPGVKPRTPIAKVSEPPEQSVEQGEDVIAWINPVTKVKSLVNQRTGLTVRTGKPNSSSSDIAPLSTTKEHSNQQRLPKCNVSVTEGPGPWLSNILKTWNSPVFCPAEPPIPQVSFDGQEAGTKEILHGRRHHCSQIDIDLAFKQSSAGIDSRISKAALSHAEVISQVDNKFILVKLASEAPSGTADVGDNDLLVLIDQHAADERIRIESLLEELFASPATVAAMPTETSIRTNVLDKPISFQISLQETQLLNKRKDYFANWGIVFDLQSNIMQPETTSKGAVLRRLTVQALPPGIIERCKLDPRLLINLIRTEAWKIHDKRAQPTPAAGGDWLQHIHNCPQGIIDMLNSRACRSAIMFNDELSRQQCEVLVSRLAKCKFPFQCAHGRPSLVPLVNLGKMNMEAGNQSLDERFSADFSTWKRNMK
jgi:DNA mismatch repair protein MLH3